MAHRLLYDPDEDGWERSDFPIVCETCLGPNPYVEFGGTCHISGRPYTVFRWRPGSDARYKKTIICQEVAKAKNVCQVCLLDLDYGLPVQVRDKVAGVETEDVPHSDVNKEYMLELHKSTGELGKQYKEMPRNETLTKMQRMAPFYKRNLAPVCTFYIRGECNRGTECPYRHEMPTDTELTEQNIKDRYYGVNDPVAEKILARMDEVPKVTPPEDTSITTLYVGGLPEDATEEDLRDQFYAYGELASIKVMEEKKCGFVTYASREDAERAAGALESRLKVKGVGCKVMWGKPHALVQSSGEPAIVLDPTNETPYPSMDPSAMGSYMPASSSKRQSGQLTQEVVHRKKLKVTPKPPSEAPPSANRSVPRPPPGPPPEKRSG